VTKNALYLVGQSLSEWPRGLRHGISSLARAVGSWARIPLEAWMFVCVYSVFVLSCMLVAALRKSDHPSKKSYRLSNNKIKKLKWNKAFTDALGSKREEQRIQSDRTRANVRAHATFPHHRHVPLSPYAHFPVDALSRYKILSRVRGSVTNNNGF
jgi:hypothetical protein